MDLYPVMESSWQSITTSLLINLVHAELIPNCWNDSRNSLDTALMYFCAEGCSFHTGAVLYEPVYTLKLTLVENLIRFWIDMNRRSRFIFTPEGDQAVTVYTSGIWFHLFSPSTSFYEPAGDHSNQKYRWLQDVFQVPIVIQLTGLSPFPSTYSTTT